MAVHDENLKELKNTIRDIGLMAHDLRRNNDKDQLKKFLRDIQGIAKRCLATTFEEQK